MVGSVLRGQPLYRGDSRLQLMLDFARKLTLAPEEVRPGDFEFLQAGGLSRAAIADSVLIVVGFNFINRVADALHFKIPRRDDFAPSARFLLCFGYRFLGGPVNGLRNNGWIKTRATTRANRELPVLIESTMKWLEFLTSLDQAANDRASATAGRVSAIVMNEPARLTEDEVRELHDQRCTDTDIFDLIISSAAAASLVRLRTALTGLSESTETRSVTPITDLCTL
jgi:alkylhydroperoxidase family enzyme